MVSEYPSTDAIWGALLAMQRLSWEQGVASHAALDEGRSELTALFAHDAVMRQDREGQLGATGATDLVNSGSLVEAVAACAQEGDEHAKAALERQRWWLLRYAPRNDDGVLLHADNPAQVWADSVYMIVPALAVCGDFAPADMQYRMHRQLLWHEQTGLYGHRFDVDSHTWVRPQAWACGNGWIAAGITRALHIGGENVPVEMRSRWQRQMRELIDVCSAHVSADNRFHDVLDDPTTFLDGTAGLMLAYAVHTAVADGWLDYAYAQRADLWIEGSLSHVDDAGLVRDVCGAPHFDRPGTSPEAQAFAIMALAAAARNRR